MGRVRIYPYKAGSKSAKELSRSTGWLRLKHTNSRFRPRSSDVIINWGSTTPPAHSNVINSASAVERASDKIQTLTTLSAAGITVPPFTCSIDDAKYMLANGKKVVCRTLTRANSGRGIVIAETEEELVAAPLYTQYVPKQDEYRVHVAFGDVLDQQRKMRDRDVADADVNWQVRNHTNGFVFGRENVNLPEEALVMATQAVAALGLDFGAVDLIYNARSDTYYVLEVNTAPGLTGTTLEKYTSAFKTYVEEL